MKFYGNRICCETFETVSECPLQPAFFFPNGTKFVVHIWPKKTVVFSLKIRTEDSSTPASQQTQAPENRSSSDEGEKNKRSQNRLPHVPWRAAVKTDSLVAGAQLESLFLTLQSIYYLLYTWGMVFDITRLFKNLYLPWGLLICTLIPHIISLTS